ncbi:MAG: methyltransferase domain-containing protein [Vicinamibacterales bacterium]
MRHVPTDTAQDPVARWLSALEQRHLADLRVPEVTRALRALSSAYVERRGGLARGAPLDSAGKRAAFALYYAPLHFFVVGRIVEALGAALPPPGAIVDIGCGTGAGGAAWALAAGGRPKVIGLDRHPWAVDEARWTYRQFGLQGDARRGDAARAVPLRRGDAMVAAYTLNELTADGRAAVERALLDAAAGGARVLVVEPIARGITPWWDAAVERFQRAGGRADEWRFPADLPEQVARFGKAAGLNQRELTARSLYCPGA